MAGMSEDELREDGKEIVVPLPPGQPVIAFDSTEEPPYGWVVCIALHLINGFTWGIIAVSISRTILIATKSDTLRKVVRSLSLLLHQQRHLPRRVRLGFHFHWRRQLRLRHASWATRQSMYPESWHTCKLSYASRPVPARPKCYLGMAAPSVLSLSISWLS